MSEPLDWKYTLQELQSSAKRAAKVLERHGFTLIYADENEQARRKELRAQGITSKIRVVPFTRPEREETR